MAEESQKEAVLTDQEIEALVEHAEDSGFDDGEFRTHDFSVGESLALSKWVELDGLNNNHAEALQRVFTTLFDIELTIEAHSSTYCNAKDLLAVFPHRLCLVSTKIGPFDEECHLVVPGETLTFLVNQYFGGASVTPPKLTSRVTPSEQRIGERVAREFLLTMAEVWVDRLPLQMGDLYVDVTSDRFSLIPSDTGFVVFQLDMAIGDDHRSSLQLLLPFKDLEAHSAAFLPRKKEIPQSSENAMWESELRATLPDVVVEVCGSIDAIETTIKNLLAMRVGVTIPIEEPDAMSLLLNDRAVAQGRYGAHEGLKAMQFTNFKEREK